MLLFNYIEFNVKINDDIPSNSCNCLNDGTNVLKIHSVAYMEPMDTSEVNTIQTFQFYVTFFPSRMSTTSAREIFKEETLLS